MVKLFLPVFMLVTILAASAQLRFEAEAIVDTPDAWLVNKSSDTLWNLWNNDKDATKKWSGGVVLQSPLVKTDRAKPEDGAPVLHAKVVGLVPGTYNIVMNATRTIGLSFDGKNWLRSTGGTIARQISLTGGIFELWVDDRYADEKSPGACYFDYLDFYNAGVVSITNPDFETISGDRAQGWNFWSRDGNGTVTIVADTVHSGRSAVRVVSSGEKDWNLSNSSVMIVKPGQAFTLKAWAKLSKPGQDVSISVVGKSGGKVVSWDIGSSDCDDVRDWQQLVADVLVPDGVDEMYVRFVGSGPTDVVVDQTSIEVGKAASIPAKPQVNGWAQTPVRERFDRGLVAVRGNAGIHVSWRLFGSDPAGLGFNLYRQNGNASLQRINILPITRTTDFVDASAPANELLVYSLATVRDGKEGEREAQISVPALQNSKPYTSIKLQGNYKAQKIGVADLNGDGKLDYVVKIPQDNIDPAGIYWKPSPDTYKLEAYLNDGTFLWRYDMGWGIERGMWYSPFIVYDFDGDGKAEVVVKAVPGDPRGPDGKVAGGEEFLVVLDGMTGKERARTAWPSREGFGSGPEAYNYASRNQIALAYLDGKTPCILALRGTYTTMKCEAYDFTKNTLRPLWKYSSIPYGRAYRGQGAHFTHAADVDGDGRDEVILGSAVIDDTGSPLWSNGRGHCDRAYVGDLDPVHPGLEIFYFYETGGAKNGIGMADAATGTWLWGWPEPTGHLHYGFCADINASSAGVECFAGEVVGDHIKDHNTWFYTAQGGLVTKEIDLDAGRGAYWDADLQRELLKGKRFWDYRGGPTEGLIEGDYLLHADVLGDWREEAITTLPGEIRIYSTPIAATDRRPCLLEDHIYRMDTVICAQAYLQEPTLSYALDARSPGLSLIALADVADTVEMVVSAPRDTPLLGTVELNTETLPAVKFTVDLKPGERLVKRVPLHKGIPGPYTVRADFEGGTTVLQAQVLVRSGVKYPF